MKKFIYILVGVFCLTCVKSTAQTNSQIEFTADKMKYDQHYKGGAQRLIGNVEFKHEGSTITCDSAYKFSNNTLEAYDHVVIRKGDSLTITGNKLKYDGNTKLAVLEGNVVCIEKDMTLTSNDLHYDVSKSVASYYGGGTIVNKDNTLTSKIGYYFSNTKELAFRHNVKLVNPEYTMFGDTLKYNTVSKTSFFIGPTNIISKQNKLYCESGWYNTESGKSHLNKNASILSEKTNLKADSIYYNKKESYGEAMGHVKIIDTTEKIIVEGDRAKNYELAGTSIVNGHTLFTRIMTKDSLFLSSDTLYIIQKKDNKTEKAATVKKDSTIIKAYHHVKIFKKDVQGLCDSLTYSSIDSAMTLYHSPILWSGEHQLSGKLIKIFTNNSKIKSFEIYENAMVVSKLDSLRYNQIKGKEIKAYFANDTIHKIDVIGSAQAVYYIKNDKKKLMGLNKTDCSSMQVYLKQGEVNRVTFNKQAISTILPIKGLNPEEHRLKGFSWKGNLRPKSKNELTN